MNKEKILAILSTYFRAFVAGVIALYILDASRPIKDYLAAGIAAVAGPLLKALDPKSKEFGRVSK